MNESLLTNTILCESLSLNQGKVRPEKLDERSKFLSSLALVLNGNATCTAVYVHQAEKIVYIARNETITGTDQRYFNQFFRLIRVYAHLCFDHTKKAVSSEVKDALESAIFEYNSRKIINRFTGRHRTVIDEFKKMAQWGTDNMKPFVEELQSNRTKYRDRPLITEKVYLLLGKYTEEGGSRSINPTDQQIVLATGLASILYQSLLFQYILDHSTGTAVTGVYYFEKTSAHKRSVNLLLKRLLTRQDSLSDLYQNVSWKLVPSIEETRTLSITPKEAFQKIFEQLSHSSDQIISSFLQNSSIDILYDEHLEKLKEIDNNPKHDVHIHAEILLIDYLLKMNINETNQSKEVEIGISNMSCLLCSYYIDELNRKYDRRFCISNSTNGKIYSKWVYRPNEDISILNLINQKLIDILQRSIKRLANESARVGPTKSGDSDIMYTSMEEEDFDTEECTKIFP